MDLWLSIQKTEGWLTVLLSSHRQPQQQRIWHLTCTQSVKSTLTWLSLSQMLHYLQAGIRKAQNQRQVYTKSASVHSALEIGRPEHDTCPLIGGRTSLMPLTYKYLGHAKFSPPSGTDLWLKQDSELAHLRGYLPDLHNTFTGDPYAVSVK